MTRAARGSAFFRRLLESRAGAAHNSRTLATWSTHDVALFTAFITVGYAVFYATSDRDWTFNLLVVNAIALGAHVVAVILARKGHQRQAAVLTLTAATIQIVHGVSVMGSDSGIHMLFVAGGVLVLVVFTERQLAYKVFFMACSAVGLTVCELAMPGRTEAPLSTWALHALSATNMLTTAGLVFALATLTYVRANSAREAANRAAATASALANTDSLTGLHNRRPILEELDLAAKSGPFVVAIGDLDRFKELNDTFGHPCGDVVLAHVARQLRHGLRPTDAVGRWGGEEFIAVLHHRTIEGGFDTIDTLRAGIAATRIPCAGHSHSATVSFGVANGDVGADLDEVIGRADAALYDAKTAGRNVAKARSVMAAPPAHREEPSHDPRAARPHGTR